MTTARDIMHTDATCVGIHETISAAAQHMRDLGVGALPICGDDDRLHGMLTDRDIVVGCVAKGHDPAKVTAGDLAQGTPRWIEADADVNAVLEEMQNHRIRRLPVVENKKLVGMISEADLAQH
ncbi:CBS domain-containing protein, partial [Streptomyces lonegramiae]